MSLEIIQFILGPMENNTYLAADTETGQAAIIDPSFDSQEIIEFIDQHGWKLSQIWLTHAHFDHIAGITMLQERIQSPVPVYIHPADLPLWREQGGAHLFGLHLETGPEPEPLLGHRQEIQLGNQMLQVRHTPGHTPGHVIFYSEEAATAFCGDLIFFHGVGRTDLPGSSQTELIHSIQSEIFSLPSNTRLLSGHGEETTVEEEKLANPFF